MAGKHLDANFKSDRLHMVEEQIADRGVRDPKTLEAMRTVRRHLFVSPSHIDSAYEDRPLPIGQGQTISQPYIVALMTEALKLRGGENVLEIGTGCGYAAAVLKEAGANVVTIERIEELVSLSRANLKTAGYEDIKVICGDGTLGYEEDAPYDGIVVTAGGPTLPDHLKHQLKIGGRLVIPVGPSSWDQRLVRVTRTGEETFEEEDLGGVCFVPLIGEEGWDQSKSLT
ncbi:protein-L-isoaspartate(D-aspartate) O-methyltransferase [uncultured Roseibium sp.]|uniref:protein-L-isoaspartate(D-aspartate) O-methyltransferase n=1 Tax=uncultured Roseibium sp. TaxID=1936171 RepID=UPI0032173C8B